MTHDYLKKLHQKNNQTDLNIDIKKHRPKAVFNIIELIVLAISRREFIS